MLILTRKPGEGFSLGEGVTVRVLEIQGGRVRLSVDVPPETRVQRLDAPESPPPPAETPER